MKRLIVIVIFSFLVVHVLNGQSDRELIRKIIKPSYTELDSNYQDSIIFQSIILVAKYERTFLFFRKLNDSISFYKMDFNDSLVSINYGSSIFNAQNLSIDYEFSSIYSHLIVFNMKGKERFAYQVLRFSNGYLVVNLYDIDEKGRLKNARKRLLFKVV